MYFLRSYQSFEFTTQGITYFITKKSQRCDSNRPSEMGKWLPGGPNETTGLFFGQNTIRSCFAWATGQSVDKQTGPSIRVKIPLDSCVCRRNCTGKGATGKPEIQRGGRNFAPDVQNKNERGWDNIHVVWKNCAARSDVRVLIERIGMTELLGGHLAAARSQGGLVKN